MKKINYLEKYKGVVGACASCINARSIEVTHRLDRNGNLISDKKVLSKYYGEKEFTCFLAPQNTIWAVDEPHMDYPVNECWKDRN